MLSRVMRFEIKGSPCWFSHLQKNVEHMQPDFNTPVMLFYWQEKIRQKHTAKAHLITSVFPYYRVKCGVGPDSLSWKTDGTFPLNEMA